MFIVNQIRYPHVKQHDRKDCGAACLSMISAYYGYKDNLAFFRKIICVNSEGSSIYGIIKGAEIIGFNAEALMGNANELIEGIKKGIVNCPFVARIKNKYNLYHFIVVYGIRSDKLIIGDPDNVSINKISIEEFTKLWEGQIICFVKGEKFKKKDNRQNYIRDSLNSILNQKKSVCLILVSSFFISFIGIINFYMIRKMISANFPISMITRMIIIFLFIYLSSGVIEVVRRKMLSTLSRNVNIHINTSYLNQLIDLPMCFHDTYNTGELMARFDDAEMIKEIVSNTIFAIILDSLSTIVFCGISVYVNIRLLIIAVNITFCFWVINILFSNKLKKISKELLECNAIVSDSLKETIDSAETIKVYCCQDYIKRMTSQRLLEYEIKGKKYADVEAIRKAFISFIGSAGTILVICLGLTIGEENGESYGNIFIYYYIMWGLINSLSSLINTQPLIQAAQISAERLGDVMFYREEGVGGEIKQLNGDINIKDLTFSYGWNKSIIQNLSLQIPKGSFVALMGNNGSGKSTLAKLLLRFYEGYEGEILLDDNDIRNYSIDFLRNNIIYAPQNTYIYSDTIMNNIKMGCDDISDDDVYYWAEIFKINDYICKLPNGYNTKLEENGNNLSGGQKQKIGLVRSMIKNPRILILDEPTSNLDMESEKELYDCIGKLRGEITCIIITHKILYDNYFDQTIRL